MKTLFTIAAVILVSSCSKKDDTTPAGAASDQVVFTTTMKANADSCKVKYTVFIGGVATQSDSVMVKPVVSEAAISKSFTIANGQAYQVNMEAQYYTRGTAKSVTSVTKNGAVHGSHAFNITGPISSVDQDYYNYHSTQ